MRLATTWSALPGAGARGEGAARSWRMRLRVPARRHIGAAGLIRRTRGALCTASKRIWFCWGHMRGGRADCGCGRVARPRQSGAAGLIRPHLAELFVLLKEQSGFAGSCAAVGRRAARCDCVPTATNAQVRTSLAAATRLGGRSL